MASQTEQVHASMGMVREASQQLNPPTLVSDSGERDCSDQLLETWMLLEYCDQGNLESAAREARFQRDYVNNFLPPSPHPGLNSCRRASLNASTHRKNHCSCQVVCVKSHLNLLLKSSL